MSGDGRGRAGIRAAPASPLPGGRATLRGLAAILLLVGGAAIPAEGTAQDRMATEFLTLLNAERAVHGLPPLRVHSVAQRRAERWTLRQIEAGTVSHQSLDDLLLPPIWRVGENVGVSSQGLSHLFRGFMESPVHRANLLNPDFTHVGVAVRRGRFQGLDALWSTQVFLQLR